MFDSIVPVVPENINAQAIGGGINDLQRADFAQSPTVRDQSDIRILNFEPADHNQGMLWRHGGDAADLRGRCGNIVGNQHLHYFSE